MCTPHLKAGVICRAWGGPAGTTANTVPHFLFLVTNNPICQSLHLKCFHSEVVIAKSMDGHSLVSGLHLEFQKGGGREVRVFPRGKNLSTLMINALIKHFSISISGEDGNILLDYSKNIITKETMNLLFNLV